MLLNECELSPLKKLVTEAFFSRGKFWYDQNLMCGNSFHSIAQPCHPCQTSRWKPATAYRQLSFSLILATWLSFLTFSIKSSMYRWLAPIWTFKLFIWLATGVTKLLQLNWKFHHILVTVVGWIMPTLESGLRPTFGSGVRQTANSFYCLRLPIQSNTRGGDLNAVLGS